MFPMTNSRYGFPPHILCILLALCAFPGRAGGAEAAALSIGDAVRIAIERNLGLRAAAHGPAISETDIRKARSIYDPSLSFLLDHRGSNLQAAPQSFFVDRSRSFDFDASLSQLLPTGATASASFTNLWYKDNLDLPGSRFAQPELTLSFSQPLLKGFGKDVTERSITTAEDAMDSALADWNQQALGTAAAARNQYLALVKARESLATRRASLALARQVHAENEGRVKAGVLAAYQLQDSMLGVLRRHKELLDAERAEKDAADQLRVTLHMLPGTPIETTETAAPEPFGHSEDDALRTALSRRPDLVKARVAVRTAEFNERVSGNLVLPSLALEGAAGLTGLDTDYGNAFDDMRGGRYPTWSVGLRFSYPLGNRFARADLAASRLKASQARTQLSAAEESAGLEVRAALRAVETQREQIPVTTQGVTAADTLLASYLKRQQLGLATTKDLLDVEAGATQARENDIAARADYQAALTDLWRATGELLDRQGIRLDGNASISGIRKETP